MWNKNCRYTKPFEQIGRNRFSFDSHTCGLVVGVEESLIRRDYSERYRHVLPPRARITRNSASHFTWEFRGFLPGCVEKRPNLIWHYCLVTRTRGVG